MLNIYQSKCISTIAEVPVASKAIRAMSAGPLRGGEEEEDVDDPPPPASAAAKPTIRVRNNLIHSIGSTATTAGGGLNHILKMPDSLFARNPSAPARPSASVSEAEADVKRLSEEVRALQWLARRKEQEWDQVVRLLKQKEEKLLVAERAKVVAAAGESEIPTIINKVLPNRSGATATAVPVIGNLVNGSEVATKLHAAAAGSIIINKQSGAVLANAAGAGHGRRILIPAGQITQAQLQAMKSSGRINANQFQSISQGKTVLAAPAATTAPSDHQRPITTASGAMLSSKFAKIAPKPLNFGAPGPKIVTVQGSANVTTAPSAAAGVNPVLVSANGGSVLAKPARQIRDSQTSQQVRPEEQEEQGTITMSSSSIPPCGFCRAKKSKFVCSYCKEKWYCSRKCQLDDWDGHEDECDDSEG